MAREAVLLTAPTEMPSKLGHLGLTAIVEVAEYEDRALLDAEAVQGGAQRRPELDGVLRGGGHRGSVSCVVSKSRSSCGAALGPGSGR